MITINHFMITIFENVANINKFLVNYLLNPYEGFTSANRSIISNEVKLTASPGKVATGRGNILNKLLFNNENKIKTNFFFLNLRYNKINSIYKYFIIQYIH